MSTWTLVDDTLGELALDENNCYMVVGYDLGWPAVRSVTELVTSSDGEIDLTAYTGARGLSLDVKLVGSSADRQRAAMRLRQYLDPRRRIEVQWHSEQYGLLRAVGRGDQFSAPVPEATPPIRARVAFRIPRGVLEAVTESTTTVAPAAPTVSDGREYDLEYDREYPAGDPPGAAIVTNVGTARTYPILRAYGPVVDPLVTLGETGYWDFSGGTGITLIDGDYIEIDTYARTCTLYPGATNTYSKLDFTTLSWGWLEPGENEATYSGTGTDEASGLVVSWHPAYL